MHEKLKPLLLFTGSTLELLCNWKPEKKMGKFLGAIALLLCQIQHILAGSGEPFAEKGQKQYEEEEEGKIIPHR